MRWGIVAVYAVAHAVAQPAEPFWGGDKVADALQHDERGERLATSLARTRARLRGLTRREERERAEHDRVVQAFEAMNDTLHSVLEPKLAKAEERVANTTAADEAAAAEAETLSAEQTKTTEGLAAAKEQVTTATAQLDEADELLKKAEAERTSAEDALRSGKDQASMLEQKLLYTEAKAKGARSAADTKHALAEATRTGAEHLRTIAGIERDRVKRGASHSIAAAEVALGDTEAAKAAAEEDIRALEGELAEWQGEQTAAVQKKALEHAQDLQHQADEAAAQAVALSHTAREVQAGPPAEQQRDWAWEEYDAQ